VASNTPSPERTATSLFGSTSIVLAIIVGAMLVSGWRAGSLDNRIEWLFWAGAILAAAGTACLGLASMPSTGAASEARGRTGPVRAGLMLFMTGPVLCVVAVFTDYWI